MSLKSEIGICKISKYDPKSEIKIYETAIYYYNWTLWKLYYGSLQKTKGLIFIGFSTFNILLRPNHGDLKPLKKITGRPAKTLFDL